MPYKPASSPPNEPDPIFAPAEDGLAAWRAIPLERWYREVAEANPHVVAHDGPCGERFLCDVAEHRADGWPRVEMLPGGSGHNPGELVFHCEGSIATLRPNDGLYRKRLAGLTRREDAE